MGKKEIMSANSFCYHDKDELNRLHVQTFPLLTKDIMYGSREDERPEWEIRGA